MAVIRVIHTSARGHSVPVRVKFDQPITGPRCASLPPPLVKFDQPRLSHRTISESFDTASEKRFCVCVSKGLSANVVVCLCMCVCARVRMDACVCARACVRTHAGRRLQELEALLASGGPAPPSYSDADTGTQARRPSQNSESSIPDKYPSQIIE